MCSRHHKNPPKYARNQANTKQSQSKSNENSMQKSNQIQPNNGPKIVPTSSPNQTKIGSGTDFASKTVLGPIWSPFWPQLGAVLGGKIGPCWGHVGSKIDF